MSPNSETPSPFDPASYGKALAARRERLGVTREQLAEMTSGSLVAIENLEQGSIGPKAWLYGAVRDALDSIEFPPPTEQEPSVPDTTSAPQDNTAAAAAPDPALAEARRQERIAWQRRSIAGFGAWWLTAAAAATAYFAFGSPLWSLIPILLGGIGLGLLIAAVVGPDPDPAAVDTDKG